MKKRELRDDTFSSYILSDFMDGLFDSVIFSIREFLKIDRIVYKESRRIHAAVIVYIFAHLHTSLRTAEGNV